MKIYYLFLFVFLFPVVNSATLSMSPQQIDFSGVVGEKICNEIGFKVENYSILIGETSWAEENYFERKLKNHNLSEKELNLIIDYPREFEITKNKTIEICITGKESGNYHGIILYRIKNKPVRVGIWMNVTLEGKNFQKITGNYLRNENSGIKNSLLITPILFLIILGGLLFFNQRRRKRSQMKTPI